MDHLQLIHQPVYLLIELVSGAAENDFGIEVGEVKVVRKLGAEHREDVEGECAAVLPEELAKDREEVEHREVHEVWELLQGFGLGTF